MFESNVGNLKTQNHSFKLSHQGRGRGETGIAMPPHTSESLEKGTHPTPVFLPGESHGQRILVGCSPWTHMELTWLSMHAKSAECQSASAPRDIKLQAFCQQAHPQGALSTKAQRWFAMGMKDSNTKTNIAIFKWQEFQGNLGRDLPGSATHTSPGAQVQELTSVNSRVTSSLYRLPTHFPKCPNLYSQQQCDI